MHCSMHRIPVGVLGASGYAGRELCALVAQHPRLSLAFAALLLVPSVGFAGQNDRFDRADMRERAERRHEMRERIRDRALREGRDVRRELQGPLAAAARGR